eukprot:568827-Prymnesium_polylepis.1
METATMSTTRSCGASTCSTEASIAASAPRAATSQLAKKRTLMCASGTLCAQYVLRGGVQRGGGP